MVETAPDLSVLLTAWTHLFQKSPSDPTLNYMQTLWAQSFSEDRYTQEEILDVYMKEEEIARRHSKIFLGSWLGTCSTTDGMAITCLQCYTDLDKDPPSLILYSQTLS